MCNIENYEIVFSMSDRIKLIDQKELLIYDTLNYILLQFSTSRITRKVLI